MNDWIIQIANELPWVNLGFLVVITTFLFAFRQLKKENKALHQEVFRLRNEFRAMNSGQVGMGREIRKVIEEMANVENIQQESMQQSTSAKTYEQAGLLLSRGASIEEVVESCEISAAEAELLAIVRNSAPSHKKHAQAV